MWEGWSGQKGRMMGVEIGENPGRTARAGGGGGVGQSRAGKNLNRGLAPRALVSKSAQPNGMKNYTSRMAELDRGDDGRQQESRDM